MNTKLKEMIEQVRQRRPLIHSITNYVTVNDCANILLACCGLNINIGTLNQRTILAMLAAGKRSSELGHPVVLDPVGAGASRLRTDTALRLMQEVKLTVIRGNILEIKTLASGSGTTKQDGSASYRNYIIDAMYRLTPAALGEGANYEVR